MELANWPAVSLRAVRSSPSSVPLGGRWRVGIRETRLRALLGRMRRNRAAVITVATALAVVAAALAGCGSGGPHTGPPIKTSQHYHGEQGVYVEPLDDYAAQLVVQLRHEAPTSATASAELAQAEESFALQLARDLYSHSSEGQNVLTSPLSADTALSMIEPGARGATLSSLAAALDQSGISSAAFEAGWSGLLRRLSNDLGPVTLHVAVSAWMQRGVYFERPYLEALASGFGDEAFEADFSGHLYEAVAAINAWVSNETAGRIRNILDPQSLDPQTVLVLANALHFRAQWASSLDFRSEGSLQFHTAAGEVVEVPAMSDQSRLEVATTSAYTAVQLPYAGGRFTAILVEPHGSMASFLARLTPSSIASISDSTSGRLVLLNVPTLSLSNNFAMVPALERLGMDRLFTPQADLSLISPTAVDVSSVEQANRLVLTTWGTDFASSTVVGIAGLAAPVPAARVTFDRPFLYVLRDGQTGTIVAEAVVNNPRAG